MNTSFNFLTGVLRGRLGRPAGTAGTGSPAKTMEIDKEIRSNQFSIYHNIDHWGIKYIRSHFPTKRGSVSLQISFPISVAGTK